MLYIPMFEIPSRESFILALLRNIVIEVNTTFPEYVALVEALADDHLVLIANRLQITGEKPFSWGIVLTVYGVKEAFKLWSSKSKKYPELTLEQRMTMLALEECNGIIAANGTVYIDTFEGQSRDIWFDVSGSTFLYLAEQELIEPLPNSEGWIVATNPIPNLRL